MYTDFGVGIVNHHSPSKHSDVGATSVRRPTRRQKLTSVRRRTDVICSSALQPADAARRRHDVWTDVCPTSWSRRRTDS